MKKKILRKITTLILCMSTLSSIVTNVAAENTEENNDTNNLDINFKEIIPALFKTTMRNSKQFKDAFMNENDDNLDASEAGIAMSLVDALQKWADALEAQISMMRGEVLTLKSSNLELSNEVSNLRTKNEDCKMKINDLNQEHIRFKGETAEDFQTMGSSITKFLDHFESFTSDTKSNVSQLNENFVKLNDHQNKNDNRMIEIIADNKALSANVQLILYNASVALFNDVEDLRANNEIFALELKDLASNYKNLNRKYDVMANDTHDMQDEVMDTLETIKLEIKSTHELTISSMMPMIKQFNLTFLDTVGKLEFNVSVLTKNQDDLTSEMSTLTSLMDSQINTIQTQTNMTIAVQDDVVSLSNVVNDLQGKMNTSMTSMENKMKQNLEVSIYNSTLLQRGFFSLERHFIEVKRKVFETSLNVVSINASLANLGDLRTEVMTIGQAMANTTTLITDQFHEVHMKANGLQESYNILWNVSNVLDDKINRLQANHSLVTGMVTNSFKEVLEQIDSVESRMYTLTNRTLTSETGLSELMYFSAELDQRVIDLNTNMTKVNTTVGLVDHNLKHIYELYELQGQRLLDNTAKFENSANIFETELSRVAAGYNNLKNALGRYVSSAGNLESNVQKLASDNNQVKGELDSLKFDMAGVKAEASGITVFITSMQKHIDKLNGNMTTVSNNLTALNGDVQDMFQHMERMDDGMEVLRINMSNTIISLEMNDMQDKTMETSMNTIKSNVVSLGNYINNINSDLGSMLTSFEAYAKRVNSDMAYMKSNLTALAEDNEDQDGKHDDLKRKYETMEYTTKTMKSDVTELTTKMYNLKTAIFEHNNELVNLKSSHGSLEDNLDDVLDELTSKSSLKSAHSLELERLNQEMTRLKTSMTSLTSTILELKAYTESMNLMDHKMTKLTTNVTSIRTELLTVKQTINALTPDLEIMHTDLVRYKQNLNLLAGKMSSMGDPARFSCAFTSDEVRVPGVITYSTCNVNTDAMMNKKTGHISVRHPGDYFLSFTANMVSVNSQAIWCAIYKQSAGNDAWQVLGMINNYQRDAGTEDDRDSGTISLITTLKPGDQVWVEWRGYGDSFLYSNPYRLISFSGFQITKEPQKELAGKSDDDLKIVT